MIGMVELNIFCDEIWDEKDKKGNSWICFATLFVPVESQQAFGKALLNCRCKEFGDYARCQRECTRRKNHDSVVTYKNLNAGQKADIAERWINFLYSNNENNSGYIYLKIFGINISYLDSTYFGSCGREVYKNIYSRFFRSCIEGGIKFYFGKKAKVVVNTVYHHKGNQQNYQNFDCANINELIKSNRITFKNPTIIFLDENHRTERKFIFEKNFIQFTDLILGSVFNAMHLRSNNENKLRISGKLVPLLKKMMEGKYGFRQSISFWPKRRLNSKIKKEVQTKLNGFSEEKFSEDLFYSKKNILLKSPEQNVLKFE